MENLSENILAKKKTLLKFLLSKKFIPVVNRISFMYILIYPV